VYFGKERKMKLQENHFSANSLIKKVLYRTIWVCLLVLVLFSTVAGGGPLPAKANAVPGTIAYVRPNDATGDEIHLIEPNGSNDRLLWRTNVPDLPELDQISSLTWRPDGTELAFASRHEEACSFYASDIYAIRSSGRGYRRITAGPACGQTSGLPTGTVNVYIDNMTDSNGPFLVYFQGAPAPKTITLAPGSSTKVTFTNVADFGNFKQWAVVAFGYLRFTSVTCNADVQPGKTVDTGTHLWMWEGSNHWTWHSPSWKADGSQISYLEGGLTPYTMPVSNTAPGMIGALLFDVPIGSYPYSQKLLTWAPPGPRANQVLYAAYPQDYSGERIYLGTAGSTSPGDILIDIGQGFGQTVTGLAWLPDSSGFLYSQTEGFNHYANIFKYTFATGSSTRLTDYTSGYPRNISVSPDGSQVLYEYQATGDLFDLYYDIDLYRMDINGTGSTLFLADAREPAWSSVSVAGPLVFDHFVYIPAVSKH
jgi:Tol biopolymer transport system component